MMGTLVLIAGVALMLRLMLFPPAIRAHAPLLCWAATAAAIAWAYASPRDGMFFGLSLYWLPSLLCQVYNRLLADHVVVTDDLRQWEAANGKLEFPAGLPVVYRGTALTPEPHAVQYADPMDAWNTPENQQD